MIDRQNSCWNAGFFGVVLVACSPLLANAQQHDAKKAEFFESRIRPVLVQHCYECHSAKAAKIKGRLLLDSRDGVLKGGASGPAVVPGKPAVSLLVQALQHENLKMPPKGKLPDTIIADFVRWVREGAFDPRPAAVKSDNPLTKLGARDHWSLRLIARPAIPAVKDAKWPRSDIDRFLLAELEAKEVKPTGDAPAHVLLRRLHYVLTGLPPTPDQLEGFEKNVGRNRADALEKTIDGLLASPHFGERWGRHWLDLVRYTDVSGSTAPVAYPQAWRYRQYVIHAFNADKPFDRFVREQIAGDLLPAASNEEKAANLIATGYLALFHIIAADRNAEKRKLDVIDDQLDVLGKNFLGISLGCARCHDHKLDPISTHDYYALAGILRSTTNVKGGFGSSEPEAIALGPVAPTSPFWMKGDKVKVLAVQDEKIRQDVAVRIGGDADRKGNIVPRGFPRLGAMPFVHGIPDGQSGRLQLTNWLLSPENPLVARVIVNRVWQHVFGQGLVRTTDNFGTTGDPPSHPALLDHLAWRFREHHRWSVKSLIKELLLTRAWQLSARGEGRLLQIDPDNRLWGRAQRRRQDAEALHDAMSFVAGRLDLTSAAFTAPKFGGGNQASTINLAIPAATLRRRAIYWPVFRKDIPAELDALTLFDMPQASSPCGTRAVSVVPAQSLFLLNSPMVLGKAEALAVKLLEDARLKNDRDRVAQLFLVVFSRPATKSEKDRAVGVVEGMVRHLQPSTSNERDARRMAWSHLCHALLISNEFLMVE